MGLRELIHRWRYGVPPGVQVGRFCVIARDVVWEGHARVWHMVQVREGSRIGSGVVIGNWVLIGPRVVVGELTRIGTGAQVHEPAVIGRDVFIGPEVFVGNDKYPMNRKGWTPQPVRIGDYAVIGAGARIMGGAVIPPGAVIGMASLVLDSSVLAPGDIAVGVPVRVIGKRPMHSPGTAHEHWAPLCEQDRCPLCEVYGDG